MANLHLGFGSFGKSGDGKEIEGMTIEIDFTNYDLALFIKAMVTVGEMLREKASSKEPCVKD